MLNNANIKRIDVSKDDDRDRGSDKPPPSKPALPPGPSGPSGPSGLPLSGLPPPGPSRPPPPGPSSSDGDSRGRENQLSQEINIFIDKFVEALPKRIGSNGMWGGGATLLAFHHKFKTNIQTFGMTMELLEKEEYSSYIYLWYDGQHYESLITQNLPVIQNGELFDHIKGKFAKELHPYASRDWNRYNLVDMNTYTFQKSIIEHFNFTRKQTPGDGHCQFHALHYHLKTKQINGHEKYTNNPTGVQKLVEDIADYISSNRNEFVDKIIPEVTSNDGSRILEEIKIRVSNAHIIQSIWESAKRSYYGEMFDCLSDLQARVLMYLSESKQDVINAIQVHGHPLILQDMIGQMKCTTEREIDVIFDTFDKYMKHIKFDIDTIKLLNSYMTSQRKSTEAIRVYKSYKDFIKGADSSSGSAEGGSSGDPSVGNSSVGNASIRRRDDSHLDEQFGIAIKTPKTVPVGGAAGAAAAARMKQKAVPPLRPISLKAAVAQMDIDPKDALNRLTKRKS